MVLWTDPGGYDAYRVERRFAPWDEAGYAPTTQKVKDIDAPARYGVRTRVLDDDELERVRGGGRSGTARTRPAARCSSLTSD